MKSYFCLFFLIVFSTLHSFAQYGLHDIDKYIVLDTAVLKLTYTFKAVPDPQKPADYNKDQHILLVGKNNMSKYYSQGLIDYVSFVDSLGKKGAMSVPENSKRTFDYEFYKYHSKGTMTVTDLGNIFGKLYTYEDKVDFDWQLHEEFSEILGFKSQKATTSFRGRDYTVWFTMDIPISDGPWKFKGLPGLIIRVADSENHYEFELQGVEKPQCEVIKYYNSRAYIKISRKDLQKLHFRKNKDAAAFSESIGIIALDFNGNIMKHSPPTPYNPIERE